MPSCDVESGHESPITWTGKKVTVNPTMDTAIGLADIEVITYGEVLEAKVLCPAEVYFTIRRLIAAGAKLCFLSHKAVSCIRSSALV